MTTIIVRGIETANLNGAQRYTEALLQDTVIATAKCAVLISKLCVFVVSAQIKDLRRYPYITR